MTARSFVGCVLVVLAVLSVIEIAVDASAAHAALRHQVRVRAPHQAPARVAPRGIPAVTEEAPPPVLTALGQIPPPASPGAPPIPAASVFVPPRV